MRIGQTRIITVFLAIIALALLSIFVGPRAGLTLLVGLAIGLTFEGLGFGFAGPWRRMIIARDPSGIIAQFLAIALVAVIAFPLISTFGDEIMPARAPIGLAMLGGAFAFGVAMQLVLGCGSGVLINAGSGNPIALIALPFFVIGSFAGSYHLIWWTELGSLPIYTLTGGSGLLVTLILVAIAIGVLLILRARDGVILKRNHLIAALILAFLAIAHLVVAGQPWGVVYGLGL